MRQATQQAMQQAMHKVANSSKLPKPATGAHAIVQELAWTIFFGTCVLCAVF